MSAGGFQVTVAWVLPGVAEIAVGAPGGDAGAGGGAGVGDEDCACVVTVAGLDQGPGPLVLTART